MGPASRDVGADGSVSSCSNSVPEAVERDVSAFGLALQELFVLLEGEDSARKQHKVMISYVEIQNGGSSGTIGMNDLFNPSRKSGHVVQAGGAPTFVEVNRVQVKRPYKKQFWFVSHTISPHHCAGSTIGCRRGQRESVCGQS